MEKEKLSQSLNEWRKEFKKKNLQHSQLHDHLALAILSVRDDIEEIKRTLAHDEEKIEAYVDKVKALHSLQIALGIVQTILALTVLVMVIFLI
jgi:uncharacterized membrane protein